MNRLFSQLLVGACFGALAGAGMAQTDTTTPAQPSGNAAASSMTHPKHSTSSKHAQHHAHTKTTSHKKSTSQPTKSSGKATASTASAASPQETAYRQALRGCANEQNQAQRDSCLDSAIARYQPNT